MLVHVPIVYIPGAKAVARGKHHLYGCLTSYMHMYTSMTIAIGVAIIIFVC